MNKPVYEIPLGDDSSWPTVPAASANVSVDDLFPRARPQNDGPVHDLSMDTGPTLATPAAPDFSAPSFASLMATQPPAPPAFPPASAFPAPAPAQPAPSYAAPAFPPVPSHAASPSHAAPPAASAAPVAAPVFVPPSLSEGALSGPAPVRPAESAAPLVDGPPPPPAPSYSEFASPAPSGASPFLAAPTTAPTATAPTATAPTSSAPTAVMPTTTAPTPTAPPTANEVFAAPAPDPIFTAPSTASLATAQMVPPADALDLASAGRRSRSNRPGGAHAGDDDGALDDLGNPTSTNIAPSVGEGQEGSHPDIVAALNAVILAKASDLHVTAKSQPMVRVDGALRPIADSELWDADKVSLVLRSIMSDAQQEQFEKALELDFAYTLSTTARFRVNIYRQRNALGAAFRLIPTEIKQLAALGVPTSVSDFAKLARGLVLVTGPTGSGKSTTLAALIDLVNSTRSDHIVTVEDPIEFMHSNKKSLVNQREVGHDTHSFTAALKHVLRQDPDVILIGELRDLETISVALTAAETGHLVFATLHTQNAAQTIDRVIDVFPPHQQGQVRAQLAATLQGVVCQTLIRKAHGEGRAVATEVLVTTPAVANLIREGKTYQIHSAMQAGREMGMHTMDQHLADLVNAKQISHQAAYEKAHDLEDLKQLISRNSTDGGGGQDFSSNGSEINYDDSFSYKGA